VTDVTAPQAQITKGISVVSLDAPCADDPDSPRTMGSILADTRHPRPYDETRINLDFKAAMKRPGLPRKGRRVFGLMIRDHDLGYGRKIAKKMNISPARLCQLKNCLATAFTEVGYQPYWVA
jgi:hypothetical protein